MQAVWIPYPYSIYIEIKTETVSILNQNQIQYPEENDGVGVVGDQSNKFYQDIEKRKEASEFDQ
jgi:hypothetical protein